MRQLAFSSAHLTASTTKLTGTLQLSRPSIVINLSDIPVTVDMDGSTFRLLQSRLLQGVSLSSDGATILVMETANNDFAHMTQEASQFIHDTWSYNNPLAQDAGHQTQQAVHTSNTLKSAKDTVNGYHLFLCHQLAETRGRIHRIHELYEVHTQMIGAGVMQKYQQESFETVFETTHMAPGYTHYPFYNQDKQYPWHTFVAGTESVWLAIVKYD